MKVVSQLLSSKGHEVLAISPRATVYDAIKKMAEHGIGALVVLDQDRLVGLLTERDYARKIILQGRRSRETRVAEIMSTDLITIEPRHSVETCMQLMTSHRIRHLPVLEEGKLVGIVSIGDVVKSIMTQQAFMIEQLENYIGGHV